MRTTSTQHIKDRYLVLRSIEEMFNCISYQIYHIPLPIVEVSTKGLLIYRLIQCSGSTEKFLTPGRFSFAKDKVLTSSLPPGSGAYSRALNAEKS